MAYLPCDCDNNGPAQLFSSLTYENILSPMILVRTGNDSMVLGIVNAMIGVGGILGGILVSLFLFCLEIY